MLPPPLHDNGWGNNTTQHTQNITSQHITKSRVELLENRWTNYMEVAWMEAIMEDGWMECSMNDMCGSGGYVSVRWVMVVRGCVEVRDEGVAWVSGWRCGCCLVDRGGESVDEWCYSGLVIWGVSGWVEENCKAVLEILRRKRKWRRSRKAVLGAWVGKAGQYWMIGNSYLCYVSVI